MNRERPFPIVPGTPGDDDSIVKRQIHINENVENMFISAEGMTGAFGDVLTNSMKIASIFKVQAAFPRVDIVS